MSLSKYFPLNFCFIILVFLSFSNIYEKKFISFVYSHSHFDETSDTVTNVKDVCGISQIKASGSAHTRACSNSKVGTWSLTTFHKLFQLVHSKLENLNIDLLELMKSVMELSANRASNISTEKREKVASIIKDIVSTVTIELENSKPADSTTANTKETSNVNNKCTKTEALVSQETDNEPEKEKPDSPVEDKNNMAPTKENGEETKDKTKDKTKEEATINSEASIENSNGNTTNVYTKKKENVTSMLNLWGNYSSTGTLDMASSTASDRYSKDFKDLTTESFLRNYYTQDTTYGCQSLSDREIIYEGKTYTEVKTSNSKTPTNRFFKSLLDCSNERFGNGSSTMQCVKEKLIKIYGRTISNQCSQCFEASVECGRSKCMWKCLWGSCTDRCIECGVKHCRPNLLVCTGFDNLPDACS